MNKERLMCMNKKIKQIIYYLVILILFIVFDKVIFLIDNKNDNCNIDEVLKLENESLKQSLKDISSIDYHDFDYTIGKITYHNLYLSDSYFIETKDNIKEGLVLNNKGLLGTYKNNQLILVKDLNLSVTINDNVGTLVKNEIHIISGDYKINDAIYTSDFSNTLPRILIGYVKNIKKGDLEDIIEVNYLKIDSLYVVII